MSSNNTALRVLMIITNQKLADKATNLYHSDGIPVHYKLSAKGTAPTEMLDILGIGSSNKALLISVLPKAFANNMLKRLNKELKFAIPGNGLAFTLPLNGANNIVLKMLKQFENPDESNNRKDEIPMTTSKNVMIACMVNQGYSEEVMTAAKAAGARGGSIIHSRSVGEENAMGAWGLGLQEEKEIVLIIANNDYKVDIMKSISEKCGVNTDAKGIVLSLPIDSVIGLSEDD